MTEERSNKAIRDILLDAAAIQYADMMSDTASVEMSEQFKASMDAMKANPKAWARHRRKKPIWKRALQTAAIFVLVCAITLGALIAISPTVRAAVINWVVKIFDTHDEYRFDGNAGATILPMPCYEITALPKGYVQNGDALELPNVTEFHYLNQEGKTLYFEYERMVEGHMIALMTENMDVSDVTVNGCPGQLYRSTDPEKSSALIWMDQDANLCFIIDGFFENEELIRMAESVQPTEK